MSNQRSRKFRAKKMLCMIDDEQEPLDAYVEKRGEGNIIEGTNDIESSILPMLDDFFENDKLQHGDTYLMNKGARNNSEKYYEISIEPSNLPAVELQCLSPSLDISLNILKSPSSISYDTVIFDNVDFVASPTIVFHTPRQCKKSTNQEIATNLQCLSDTPKSSNQLLKEKQYTELLTEKQSSSLIVIEDNCSSTTNDDIYPNIIDVPFEYNATNSESTDLSEKNVHIPSNEYLNQDCRPTQEKTPIAENSISTAGADLLVETDQPMIDFSAPDSSVTDPPTYKELTRKRRRHEDDWQRVKNKKQKNTGQKYTGCNTKKLFHPKVMRATCKCTKKCGEKILQDRREAIFNEYWSLGDHVSQWNYILRHVTTKDITKMQLVREKNRTQTIKYYFRNNAYSSSSVNVCKVFFTNTLAISEKTIYTALEKAQSEKITDDRGTHSNRPRKMSDTTELSIVNHIKLFPAKESHYVRKETKKLYLGETLNISKMYRLYKEWIQSENYFNEDGDRTISGKIATKRQYETVFNTKFNYSFHKPKKDMCGSCSIYQLADEEKKKTLEEVHLIHIKIKETVRQLKVQDKTVCDPSKTTVAIFDLEKVLTIPQSEVGIFHYKRKYPIYNFTVYDTVNGKGYCYTWHYQIAKRGASEIGSCLLNFIERECRRGVKNFHFYSDGCGGQNRNRIIFAFYMYVSRKYGINIIHRYFETGHSQSEGDAMHSCIERAKKNHTIFTPDQMYSIIMNAKVNGEKYQLIEMDQNKFFDLKELLNNKFWLRADHTNDKVMWSKIHEVRINYDIPDVIFYKYNYDDEVMSINTSQIGRPVRGKGKKSANNVSSDIVLRKAYTALLPLPKPLYDDLLSLCRSEAIPRHYHSFYDSLYTIGQPEEPDIIDHDEE